MSHYPKRLTMRVAGGDLGAQAAACSERGGRKLQNRCKGSGPSDVSIGE